MVNQTTKQSPAYLKWVLSGVAMVLVVLGVISNLFSIMAFVFCAGVILFCNRLDTLVLMVFLMPFSNIFKLSPTDQSFYTYLMIFYVAVSILKAGRLNKGFFFSLLVMISFVVLQFLMSMNVLRTIKYLINLVFIYLAFCNTEPENYKDFFWGYITGMSTASLLVLSNWLPRMNQYLRLKEMTYEGDALGRFSGMYGDPNYFAVNIIICLCLLVILFHKKDIKPLTFLFFTALIGYFVILTYSKSAFLMLVVPVGLFLYSNIKRKRMLLQLLCLSLIVVLLVNMLAGRIEFLSVILGRLSSAENINELTTGRIRIWNSYLEELSKLNLHFFIGNGFGAETVVRHFAHNTYIDMMFYLGLGGIILYVVTLINIWRSATRRVHKNLLNFGVLIAVMAMYFFLSMLFYFDMPFHILLAMMAMNMDMTPQQKHLAQPEMHSVQTPGRSEA